MRLRRLLQFCFVDVTQTSTQSAQVIIMEFFFARRYGTVSRGAMLFLN
jgi:hypothetical protein